LYEKAVIKISLGKPEGKIPLGRLVHIWKDNIRMDLREVGSSGSG
jgi:hypothetical protein